ncbi:protein bunched, class 2/F/G isoform [Diachasmimorpha longicaudata]|uniref:protein bunched, class 2/F/G isoform n=1 Tax=Diachasmimorpha longicaudata TaxID=58733 RepID=UPI0030B8B5E3
MADNVHRKTHKTTDGNKKLSAPVNRTTSETIRIGGSIADNDKNQGLGQIGQLGQHCITPSGNNLTSTPNNNQCRKKTSSFQITSVTVGSRMSNDAGEDSNDDLDESHGEDNSVEHSRIENTDIETPSYSEDTFSKDDVFFNASNAALSTAPVIPTSSQYGLAIVPSDPSGNVSNSSNDSNINALELASVTDNNIINLLSSNTKQDTDGVSIRDGVSHGRNERFKVVKIESTEPFKRGRWTCMDYLDHTSVNNQTNAINTGKTTDPNQVCISYGVNDGVILPLNTASTNDERTVAVDMNGHATHQDMHGSIGISNNQAAGYTVASNSLQSQNCQRNPTASGITLSQQPYFHSSAQQQQQGTQQQPPPPAQGSTLPSNLQPTHANNLGQPQSMPQGSIPIIPQTNNNNVTSQQNISHTNEDSYVNVAGQNQSLPGAANQANIMVQNQGQTQSANQSQSQTNQHQINDSIATIQRIQGMQKIHQVPQSGGQHSANATPPQQSTAATTAPGASNANNTGVNPQATANCQNAIGTMNFHPDGTEQDSVSGIADAALLECLAEVAQSTDDHQTLEENESMSGTGAVAIDNKIEQAMDLVKSHLMFAVREEVEVLKEKIAELMDRINQLEAENSILKAHATAETLAQLNQSSNKLPQNNSTSGQ